ARVGCDGVSSLGHVVQSLGVPLTEVGRLVVNGRPVPPRDRPGGGGVVEGGAGDRPRLGRGARVIRDAPLGTLDPAPRPRGGGAGGRPRMPMRPATTPWSRTPTPGGGSC